MGLGLGLGLGIGLGLGLGLGLRLGLGPSLCTSAQKARHESLIKCTSGADLALARRTFSASITARIAWLGLRLGFGFGLGLGLGLGLGSGSGLGLGLGLGLDGQDRRQVVGDAVGVRERLRVDGDHGRVSDGGGETRGAQRSVDRQPAELEAEATRRALDGEVRVASEDL